MLTSYPFVFAEWLDDEQVHHRAGVTAVLTPDDRTAQAIGPGRDLPALGQPARRHQSVARVVPFPGENDAFPGARKKFFDGTRDPGARLLHQRLRRDAARESRFLGRAHLRRSDDR
jgi:hypothetical protein